MYNNQNADILRAAGRDHMLSTKHLTVGIIHTKGSAADKDFYTLFCATLGCIGFHPYDPDADGGVEWISQNRPQHARPREGK